MKLSGPAELSKSKLKLFARLHQKKFRDEQGLFLAEGFRTVKELCMNLPDADMLVALLVREGELEALRFAQRWKDKLFTAGEKECSLLAGTATSQGVFGVFRKRKLESDLAETAGKQHETSFIVALDDVQDPGNVGTIMRSAVWFGADAVICSSGTADPYNPKTVRSCAGSIYALRHYSVNNLETEIQRLSGKGYTIVASSLDGRDFHDFAVWPEKLVLVIGNEANGISRPVQALAKRLVRIPHAGEKPRVESLNAAVSAGILMERMFMR
ncbi:MAG: RNA methyltransferase [Chlorobiaceae bacterium]|nr:RNA methyltransferase [Chlorobiaceae bacterium]